MSRCFRVCAFALLGIALAAFQVSAQSQDTSDAGAGGSRGRSSSDNSSEGFGLLRIPVVQNDLRLTDEQKVQILSLTMEMRKTRLDIRKKLPEILKPDQFERLKEIRLQVEGPAGMNSHEVAMSLGLTREQRLELKALQTQISEEMNAIIQANKGLTSDEIQKKMPAIVEKMQQVRKETTEKALGVLTPEQLEKFDKMQGKKLNFGAPPAQP